MYAYDSLGNMTSVQDQTGTFVTDFDKLNRVVTKRTQAGSVYYQYDRTGLKSLLADTDSTYTYYGYDAASRLAFVTLLDGTPRAGYFVYDPSGMVLAKYNPGNRIVAYYTYDNAGRLSVLNNLAPSTNTSVAYFSYTRDQNGNISYFLREDGGTTYYAYDALDRVIKDERRDNMNNIQYGYLYNYDPASNRYFKFDQSAGVSPVVTTYYVYDANNLLKTEWKVQ